MGYSLQRNWHKTTFQYIYVCTEIKMHKYNAGTNEVCHLIQYLTGRTLGFCKTVCKVWTKYIMVKSETLIQTSTQFRGEGEEGGGENTRNYIFMWKRKKADVLHTQRGGISDKTRSFIMKGFSIRQGVKRSTWMFTTFYSEILLMINTFKVILKEKAWMVNLGDLKNVLEY
jgi:hypothetical protein